MTAQHEHASPNEHMQAMQAKLDAIFKAEEDACVANVSVTAEEVAEF